MNSGVCHQVQLLPNVRGRYSVWGPFVTRKDLIMPRTQQYHLLNMHNSGRTRALPCQNKFRNLPPSIHLITILRKPDVRLLHSFYIATGRPSIPVSRTWSTAPLDVACWRQLIALPTSPVGGEIAYDRLSIVTFAGHMLQM